MDQRKCRAKRKLEKASGASSDMPWMDVGTTCNDLEEVANEEPPEAVVTRRVHDCAKAGQN